MNDQPSQPTQQSSSDEGDNIERPEEQQDFSQPADEQDTSFEPEQPVDFSAPVSSVDLSEPISWQAAEGVENERSTTWYAVFVAVMLVLMALAIFVFKNITFAILIPVMTTATFILLKKSPRVMNYSITPKGIYVGDHLYDFSEFRSFGIVTYADAPHIILFPVKRFSVGATLYFDEKDGEKIVDHLGARIPMQEVKPDMFEKLIHWIKL